MSRYRIKHVYPYYNGCIPIDVWIVQKYESGFLSGKWVNIKGFDTYKKAEELYNIISK